MSIQAGSNGKCPHCGIANKFETVPIQIPGQFWEDVHTMAVKEGNMGSVHKLFMAKCGNGECRRLVLFYDNRMLLPLASARPQAQPEVPEAIASDYQEACLVEPLSQKAAAALARRCLQNMLKDRGVMGAPKRDLDSQITEAMQNLPSDLADDIDAIRVVGNYAAHPNKSKSTGEIIEVEPHETSYLLDTLYSLFDHYYVRPAQSAAKRAALQAKLKAAGSGVTLKTTGS